MPNLILTYRCNNACPFCFNENPGEASDLSFSAFKKMLPFIRSFQREGINIVGGEPTLNSEFIPILRTLLDENFLVTIFTNGKIPDTLSTQLQHIVHGEFLFCVNRTDPELVSTIIRFYQCLGYRIKLSLTYYKQNQYMQHIIREIDSYRLNREVRIGIALPAGLKRQNVYLNPNEYSLLSQEVFDWIKECTDANIRVTFDCGLPICFFSKRQREYFKENQINFVSNCGIIPDITPDGSIIPCFPLARFKKKISHDADWYIEERKLKKVLAKKKMDWLFPECETCPEPQTGACCGGCMALRMKE